MAQKIAILGLGTMGIGMAKNLLKKGFEVTAYNRTQSKAEALVADGGKAANTPAEAVREADVVISILADNIASREVFLGANGAVAALRPGTVVVESSTVTPDWIGELSLAISAKQAILLDAPVTGSKVQAEGGKLNFLVGGENEALEKARPALEAMGQGVMHFGPVGSGARMKLINNFLAAVQVASLAEAMVWIERSGLKRDQALEMLKGGAPGSPLLQGISARMTEATYDVNFYLALMEKDLKYAQADAKTLGIELKTAAVSEQRFKDAVQAGFGDKDMSAVVEPIRHNHK